MKNDFYKRLKTQWETVKSYIEIADSAFAILRIIVLGGGIGWLIFSKIPEEMARNVGSLFVYFVSYCLILYLLLFLYPQKKKSIYLFLFVFDLSFMTALVNITGGFDSSFSNGFYLMTALYSFYYGLVQGVIVALIATVLYLVSGNFDFNKLYWTDFSLRVAFLFLLAVPLGMLSQRLKTGKDEIEHLNKELQEYIEGLRDIQGKLVQAEKLSAIGRLTADVAHEIRNPLTCIGGFVRRLDKRLAPGSKEKEYAELIIFEVNRLERILRDVLAFSREPKAHMEPQGINNIVKESLLGFIDICNEQSIRIEEKLDTSLPPVLIDKDQIREAVNNLISNAVDAMPEGGVLKVKTCMERMYEVNYVVVEVTDTGSGISEEKLNMIFEPFFTTKKIGAGTGLGLSICKKIVDEHNGLIRVISELGKGTTFRLFFPYQSEEEKARIKCWEFHKCGVEKAEGAAEMRCRAYPHFGRICWVIAGTFCEKKVSGAIAQKLGDCRKCEFYKRVAIRKDL
jgi:signal transduction histidine kinase